jgi:tetratricopeptide (TPR) repeat protein
MRLRLLVLACILSAGVPVWAADTPAPSDLAAAEAHWAARAQLDEARAAVAAYQAATAASPGSYEAWWRLARACWWLGDHVPKSECLAVYDQGKAAADRAVALDPGRVEGHYWLGVCLGRTGEERGILNSLFMVDPIAKAMEACLAIDPKYGRAQHVLGVLYRKAPGWPLSRGDMNRSLEYARSASANASEAVITHVGLAETLIALGRKDEARQVLTKALELPGPADEQPETAKDKAEAARLLQGLK